MQKAFATTTLHKEQWTCMHAQLKVTALVRRATLPSLQPRWTSFNCKRAVPAA